MIDFQKCYYITLLLKMLQTNSFASTKVHNEIDKFVNKASVIDY
jgi:hypothetical protein